MLSPEQFYEVLGIRREYNQANIIAVGFFLWLSNLYARKSGLVVEGSAPARGETLFISNHPDDLDPLRVFHAGANYVRTEEGKVAPGRLVRFLAKAPLFGIKEPAAVRRRTGKSDIWNSDSVIVEYLMRATVGQALYGIGAIPVKRGMTDQAAVREISQALEEGQLVGTTLIGSRDESGGLKGLKTGAAVIVMRRPHTPFRLVGISRDPHLLKIGEPQTGAQVMEEMGHTGLRQLTMFLADSIIDLLPPNIQKEWQARGREAALQELSPKGERPNFATTS